MALLQLIIMDNPCVCLPSALMGNPFPSYRLQRGRVDYAGSGGSITVGIQSS